MESLLLTLDKSLNCLHAKFQLPLSKNVDLLPRGGFSDAGDPFRGFPGTYFGGRLLIYALTCVYH